MPRTHLIRNCPRGNKCEQTWESLELGNYRKDAGIKHCSLCKKTVHEVSEYPINPFLLEHNCVIAILYDISDLKKMIDNKSKPMVQPKMPKFSDEQTASKKLVAKKEEKN